MLIQLLELFKENRSYSLQELSELTSRDIDDIKMEIEYLENNGYIRKIQKKNNCCENKKCNSCKVFVEDGDYWEIL